MTIQTIKGIYSMVDDVLGGGNGNPEEVIVAVHHALTWIDEYAPNTDWRSIIEAIFNTYVEAFVCGKGRKDIGTDVIEDCEYLQHNLDGVLDTVLHLEADEASEEEINDAIIDDLTNIFA